VTKARMRELRGKYPDDPEYLMAIARERAVEEMAADGRVASVEVSVSSAVTVEGKAERSFAPLRRRRPPEREVGR